MDCGLYFKSLGFFSKNIWTASPFVKKTQGIFCKSMDRALILEKLRGFF